MRAPSKTAHDVAGIAPDGNEGSVNRLAAYRVIDHVEAVAFGIMGDILLCGKSAVVNGGCAEGFDNVSLAGRNSGEHLRSESLCQLHSDVPDSAGACVDQHLLACVHLGTIGDAFLGLVVLRGGFPDLAGEERAVLISRFQLPEPRVELGPRLAGIAHAMLDVSDGLVADLGHICEASHVGACVALAELPLSPAARQIAAGTPDLPLRLATAGDDYELLFTAPPEASETILRLAAELRLPLTAIGTIEPGAAVRLVDAEGKLVPVAAAGYRHF